MSKIIKVILDNGDELEYAEKPREFFTDNGLREWNFNYQHYDFEREVLENFNTDLESYAKAEYNLVEESDLEDVSVDSFSDEEIYDEAVNRGLFENEGIQNPNIANSSFIYRFINIVNRGDDVEIEKMLDLLEYRFKIG